MTPPPAGRARGTVVGPVAVRSDAARALLGSGPPREVLARIVPDDPLALRRRVGARLAEGALLCDAEQVLLRAQALCAWHARSGREAPDLERWLDERVDEALAAILAEAEPGDALAAFATPLALDAAALAEACARFDRLPVEQREAFFALVLADGGDRAARARGLSLTELARRARAALEPFRLRCG
jgi:hypothetical protein